MIGGYMTHYEENVCYKYLRISSVRDTTFCQQE